MRERICLLFGKCQLSDGPMTKPRLFKTKMLAKLQKVICAPSQAKPQPLSLSCSCVSGSFALCTISHAIKVCRAINTIDFLSDQPCVTRPTYSLFRGASMEKGAISDCLDCAKQDGHCQILFVAQSRTRWLQKSELLLLPWRSGVWWISQAQGVDLGHKLQERGRFSSFLLALAFL